MVDSRNSAATIAVRGMPYSRLFRRPPRTSRATAAITPHTTEGARSHDSTAKEIEPVMLPSRS